MGTNIDGDGRSDIDDSDGVASSLPDQENDPPNNQNQQQQLAFGIRTPKKRRTMIKHVVGRVRATSYCLPEDDFVYGIANVADEEGAGTGKFSRLFFTPSLRSGV